MVKKNKGYLCPVCGEFIFEEYGDFEICTVCDWQNSAIQVKYPDLDGGANRVSFNQARENWKRFGKIEP